MPLRLLMRIISYSLEDGARHRGTTSRWGTTTAVAMKSENDSNGEVIGDESPSDKPLRNREEKRKKLHKGPMTFWLGMMEKDCKSYSARREA